ncbi:hypothetical protein CRG98_007204, partial [Punica granatum]
VMQTEGYKHLEESCPSLLSDVLRTYASGDENSGPVSGKKRSASSIFGQDPDHDRNPTESVNLDGRRQRRRV